LGYVLQVTSSESHLREKAHHQNTNGLANALHCLTSLVETQLLTAKGVPQMAYIKSISQKE